MSFAVKIGIDETVKLSGTALVSLIITNIALGPQEKNGSLFIRQKQTDDHILIVSLQRGRNQSYSCSIRLLLDGEHFEELQARNGEVHILGNYQLIQNQENVNAIFENPIKIRRKIKQDNQILLKPPSIYIEEQNSIKNRPKRNVVVIKQKTLQVKQNKQGKNQRSSNKPKQKKEKSLLQMMKNIDKNDSESDDDESYQQQSQQEQSQSGSDENQKQQAKDKILQPKKAQKASKVVKKQAKRSDKKKSSWAAMLQGANDQDSQEDEDQYSQQSESSQSLQGQEEDKQTPQAKPRKMKKIEDIPENTDKIQIVQKAPQVVPNNMASSVLEVVNQIDSDSSPFQFQVPKGLPSFVTKK